MDFRAIWTSLRGLFDDIKEEDQFFNQKPLLAHYTTIDALDKILESGEFWLSNPLLMNDYEEVAFGIGNATRLVGESTTIRDTLRDEAVWREFLRAYEMFWSRFSIDHVLNVYIFCLSRHDKMLDANGKLSMWRGYGGNGNGAAIVFRTDQFPNVENAPLILTPIEYASNDQRIEWINAKIEKFCELVEGVKVDIENAEYCAQILFSRFELFSLYTKHNGFSEEREWRVAYLPSRDTGGVLAHLYGYAVSSRGIAPKLKLKIEDFPGAPKGMRLEDMIDGIILGPTSSSPLSKEAVIRMCDRHGRPSLKERITTSSIPFRPLSG